MRICMIVEGSYPYITGGVSSWMQMFLKNMPEHEFIIYAIGAEVKNKGKFVYSLPDNVVEVKEIFLDQVWNEQKAAEKRYQLAEKHVTALKALIDGKSFNWEDLFSIITEVKVNNVNRFFMSKEFFQISLEAYQEKYSGIPFINYFWNVRSMLLTLFYIMMVKCPEADLYHSVSTGYAGVIGSMGKYLYGKPFVLTEHGIYTREREEDIIKSKWVDGNFKDMWISFFYSLSRCAYSSADKVVTLFEKNKQLEVELGCDRAKIDIIPNGVNVNDYKGIARKDKKEAFINIGAVVRVTPIKDIKTMIQSFLLVKEEVPQAIFYIMGPVDEDEKYYQECKDLMEALHVKDIHFTGKVNVKEYIGKMEILVLTSISEGQPLAILEGMACGIPFVATDVGSCAELLYGKDDGCGKAGLVAPVMNYEKIARSIIQLCHSESLRLEMGNNALRRVSNLYTIDRFISKYKNLYNLFRSA